MAQAPPPADSRGAGADPPAPAPAARRALLLTLAGHILTALVAIALSLLLVRTTTPPSATLPIATRPPVPASPPAAPQATMAATTPGPQPNQAVLLQRILDIEAELAVARAARYLLVAALQLGQAGEALQRNDLPEVDRLLAAIDTTLALAYEQSAEVNKGPVRQLRAELATIRDDLYLRPEGLDTRLMSLRQSALSLAGQ